MFHDVAITAYLDHLSENLDKLVAIRREQLLATARSTMALLASPARALSSRYGASHRMVSTLRTDVERARINRLSSSRPARRITLSSDSRVLASGTAAGVVITRTYARRARIR